MIAHAQVGPPAGSLSPSRALPDREAEGAWFPPLGPTELRRLLQKMRAWEPFDADALLDDVATVLDDVPPAEEHQDGLAACLRGHLVRLVDIALGGDADVEDPIALALIERARDMRSAAMPGNPRSAVGHLRRMAWTVNELLERLSETGHLTHAEAA